MILNLACAAFALARTLSRGWVIGLVLALAAPPAARAQERDRTSEARALYDAGAVAFSDGRFEAALSRFQESYALSELPALLYNIATAHDRLNQYEEAIEQYEAYLEAIPNAQNANYTRRRIALLRSQLAPSAENGEPEETREADEPDEADTTDEVQDPSESAEAGDVSDAEGSESDLPADSTVSEEGPRESGSNVGPIALMAGGGAVLVTGVALALAANGQYSDLEETCIDGACPSGTQGDIDRLRRLGVGADVLMAVGGAAALGGLVWYFTGRRSRDETTAVRVDVAPTGVTLRGAF
ncbi:MAG: hypothetical protein AAF938_02915 [Myxococcota bacterium]